MQENRLQIGPPQRYIHQFEARAGGVVEQAGNQSGIFDGEFSGAIQQASCVLLDPCSDHAGRSVKVRQYLAARRENVLYKLFMGALGDDAAVIDDGDAITEPLRLL